MSDSIISDPELLTMDVETDPKNRNKKEEPENAVEPSTSNQAVQRTEEIMTQIAPAEESSSLEPISIAANFVKVEVKEEEEKPKVRDGERFLLLD